MSPFLLRRFPPQAWGQFLLILLLCWPSYSVWAAPTTTPMIQTIKGSRDANFQQWVKQLAQAQVIYLGETHDRPADHQAQMEIIQALLQKKPGIALGLEMFQRPFQGVLDRYLAGQLTEVQLQEESEYAQRWGFPWSSYAPVLRLAKEHQLPVLALNTPTEITRQVARNGLESLISTDFTYIPPLEAIDLTNQAYRQRLAEIFQAHHQGQSHSLDLDRFFQAQVLWDETMAAVIADYVKQHPEKTLIVLVGQGHLHYGDGIPQRVQRRLATMAQFRQVTVLLNPDPGLAWQSPTDQPIADVLWYSQ
ncbi:ChaN family lipoprotein [Thermosynechococcaceae cyanobacterium BACA0444]|uniref:ChaN family lipoprotein n=1 Tax=Pseudocalidococcus azoricus BACA0444 TaxID=2918990 RepID=A0AAE4FS52_9CYAN|nr:ChaN family lipoprotein [Pseudocalidococcus azoricus]MDS3860557.1 ChaN family lipoprotein [Pseudocalidococcus azoricus BACA0444]